MNKWVGIGNLIKDSELRYSQNNKAICNFAIAVNEGFGDKKTTQYFNIVSFGAEKLSEYLVKGTKVAIVGKLSNSSYEKDGQKYYKTEIIADSFGGIELLGSKPQTNKNQNNETSMPYDVFGGGGIEEEMTIVNDPDMPW